VAHAAEAREERAVLERQHRALDRDLAKARRRNAELRGEIEALASDPVYVESLLRRWRMSAPAEKIIE
jgi:cell division protein FtsB